MKMSTGGDLPPGPFAVGFQTKLTTDYSRVYGSDSHFRPVLVALWYPAVESNQTDPLHYGDYLRIASNDPQYAEFAQRMTAYLRNTTIQYGLDGAGLEALAQREQLAMRAVHAAAPAPGRFPVVVYHPGLGGSYDDNSVLCEYLASHGYLVASSAFSPEDQLSLNIDWDLERSFNDLSFLMNVLAQEPNADLTRMGAIGQSYGAQALLAWSSVTNSPVQAVVSLDSTVDYAGSGEPGFARLRTALEQPEKINAAWLLCAVAENNPNWAQWEYLTHTLLWRAETGMLGHNDFTSQGLIGTVQRHENPAEALLIRQRYDSVCQLAHRFLDAYVKKEGATPDALFEALPGLTVSYQPPTAGLPTAGASDERLSDPPK